MAEENANYQKKVVQKHGIIRNDDPNIVRKGRNGSVRRVINPIPPKTLGGSVPDRGVGGTSSNSSTTQQEGILLQ